MHSCMLRPNPYNNDCIDGAQTVVQVKQNKQTKNTNKRKTLGNKMLESDYTRKKNDIALTRSCLISQPEAAVNEVLVLEHKC